MRELVLGVVKAASTVADKRRAARLSNTYMNDEDVLGALDAAVEAMRDYALAEAVKAVMEGE